jgi:hypothetical protein
MVTLVLPEHLVHKLEDIARRENCPIEEVVASMVEKYEPQLPSQKASDDALDAIAGVFDDDITDLSTTVRETLQKYYQEKYGRPD